MCVGELATVSRAVRLAYDVSRGRLRALRWNSTQGWPLEPGDRYTETHLNVVFVSTYYKNTHIWYYINSFQEESSTMTHAKLFILAPRLLPVYLRYASTNLAEPLSLCSNPVPINSFDPAQRHHICTFSIHTALSSHHS